jgi:hypothetical protein
MPHCNKIEMKKKSMPTRSATATIAGYIYQFDYTIKSLLDLLNDDDSVDIENIEDVDIHSCTEDTAIQCKYYAATEYNHSIIAKPIRLMLNHYLDVKQGKVQPINYKLYGFYESGQDKLTQPITIEFLKEHFLTYTKNTIKQKHHEDLGLNDTDLADFLAKLTINIHAENDSTQFNNIITKLMQEFNCDDSDAEYYYNNALTVISHTAKQNNTAQRKITKKNFINQINKKEFLFNKWFLERKGEKNYCSYIRKNYFAPLNSPAYERFFLIEIDNNFSKSDLKELLLLISKNWTKIAKRESNPFCPYIFIHNIEQNALIELKRELNNDGIKFIDGYDYEGADFSVNSIIQTPNYHNPIKLKFINTLDNLKIVLQTNWQKTKEIYQFYFSEPYFIMDDQYTKHVKIQVKNLILIKEII